MPKVARTVHALHPETGELVTLLKGQEVDDDEFEEIKSTFNNPAIWEAEPDLESLNEEEFFFAADANGVVDPDEAEARKNARKEAEGFSPGDATGSISFDEDDYDTWDKDSLQAEIDRRNEEGAGIEVGGKPTKGKLINALREHDNSSETPPE